MPLRLLGRSYLPEVFLEISQGPRSFNDLRKQLKAAPNILSSRIRDLKRYQLVEAVAVEVGDASRLKYRLTREGERVAPLVRTFWSSAQAAEQTILAEGVAARLEGAGRARRRGR